MSLRFSITASYSSVLKRPSQLPAKLFFFRPMSSVTRASEMSGRICPITVSGAIFNARITLGYSEFKSIDAIHLCKPFLGNATYAPAACVFSSSRFLRLGTCKPLCHASLTIACSVTATAPIVVCSKTVFACASSLLRSINLSFLSSLSSSAVSCMLYSMNFLKSLLYNWSKVPS